MAAETGSTAEQKQKQKQQRAPRAVATVVETPSRRRVIRPQQLLHMHDATSSVDLEICMVTNPVGTLVELSLSFPRKPRLRDL